MILKAQRLTASLLCIFAFLLGAAAQGQDTVTNARGIGAGGGQAGMPPYPREWGIVNEDTNVACRTNKGKNYVENELMCLQCRLKLKNEPNNLLGTDESARMIELLSPAFEASFKKFKITDPNERALFYAQTIVESGGFRHLAETADFRGGRAPINAGDAGITQIIKEDASDADFVDSHRTGSRSYGEFRGRGLIQLTGCDNYFSTLHYLNHLYAGHNPQCRKDWRYSIPGRETKKQITAKCSDNDIVGIQNEYRTNQYMNPHNLNPNIYNAFVDPINLGLVGVTLTDSPERTNIGTEPPKALPNISSAEFMVDASLAYWKCNCDNVSSAIKPPYNLASMQCTGGVFRREGEPFMEKANRCATQCVKRSGSERVILGESDKRLRYLKDLVLCMQLQQ